MKEILKNFAEAKFVVLALMGVVFFFLNYGEPLRCDDLIYQYYWLNEKDPNLSHEPIDLGNRIDDVFESFTSQCNHYIVMNGRFLVHFIVQCFCGFWGRPLFNILNTFIYVFFLIGCLRFLNIWSSFKAVGALSFLWLSLPVFYIFWYSISFAVNYLWTSTALIYFILFFRKTATTSSSNSFVKVIFLFLVGFLVGSMHEGFSLPLIGAISLYLLVNRKGVNRGLIFMFLGASLGTMLVLFSPGILGRGSSSLRSLDWEELLIIKMDVLRYSKRLFLLLIVMILYMYRHKNLFMSFVSNRLLELSFIVFDFLFVLSLPHYSQRVEFPLELLSLLLFIEIVLNSTFVTNKLNYISSFFLIIMIVHALFTMHYAKLTKVEYEEMITEYHQSPKGITHFKGYYIPKLFIPYIHRIGDEIEWEYISLVYQKDVVVE